MEELVLRRQALPPEQAVRPPTLEELAGLRVSAVSYGRPWRKPTLGPWFDPRRSSGLMPLGIGARGGQSPSARRADGTAVRGVVWGACRLLEQRGLFQHTRQLEEDVELTFRGCKLAIRTVRWPAARDLYDPAALAGAHAERLAGEQLGLTL